VSCKEVYQPVPAARVTGSGHFAKEAEMARSGHATGVAFVLSDLRSSPWKTNADQKTGAEQVRDLHSGAPA
jgi:hypothetical protein